MAGKDPKDMTVSEQLRWAANGEPYNGIDENIWTYPTGKIRALAEAVTGEWPSDNEIFSIIADKIDAELAKARRSGLERAAKSWAKANGWPDFREGEDFGAWLDRCALKLPCDKDGEPVQFGDDTDELDGVEKFIFLRNGGCCQMQDADGNICNVFHGKRVKRRAPEVLGADGLPLDEDDTVYGMGREQHRYTVQVPYSINEEVGKRFCVQCYDHDEGNITWCDPSMLTHERPVLGADGKPIVVGETVWLGDEYSQYAGSSGSLNGNEYSLLGVDSEEALLVEDDRLVVNDKNYVRLSTCNAWCPASFLTHTQPDTQERIDADKKKENSKYWGCCFYCNNCPAEIDGKKPRERYGSLNCSIAQGLDIARRQYKLDKRKGGDA